MPCSKYPLPNGGVAIICHGRGRSKRCSVEGCTFSGVKLCDYPLAGAKTGKTCDRPLCTKHATQIGAEVIRLSADPRWDSHPIRMQASEDTVDMCPVHARFMKAETEARTAASDPIVVHVMASAKGTRTRCAIDRPEYGVQPDVAADPAWGARVLGLAICVRCARSSRAKPPDPPRPRAAIASGVLFPDFIPPTRKDPR